MRHQFSAGLVVVIYHYQQRNGIIFFPLSTISHIRTSHRSSNSTIPIDGVKHLSLLLFVEHLFRTAFLLVSGLFVVRLCFADTSWVIYMFKHQNTPTEKKRKSPADTVVHQHSVLPSLGTSFNDLHICLVFHNLDCLRTPAYRKDIDIRSHHRQDTNYWKEKLCTR